MTTHRMTIDVTAWQVQLDGSLPEEAMRQIDVAGGWRSGRNEHGMLALFSPRFPATIPHFRCWFWYGGPHTDHNAAPGDWVVKTPYGLEAMTDEQFRACRQEGGEG